MNSSSILTNKTPFLETIYRLRSNEEIVIFEKQSATSGAEENEVIFFLETEYGNESVDYAYLAPPFHQPAVLWAAKIIYFGAQLLLFREETAKDIPGTFPGLQKSATWYTGAIICRYMPAFSSAFNKKTERN